MENNEPFLKRLVHKFPGILYPTHPVSAHGLIGFLRVELSKSDILMDVAKKALPVKEEKNGGH